ncbi:MAG: DeoD-type purine-nucleoside phosphorylase [Bifidobacteriaceae bacterium]|jgi:purine-nucleoside phosphorylase|nr:DeoD-type purine-nucleoside phosphorylase [Bifidobacteriaceae bacterium]
MATPHNSAEPGDFAPAVIMPGDPKRAERIAAQILEDCRLVTDVRGIGGFTGTCQGKPLSVMASGMGMPSFSIYATELFRFYGVDRIIRVGTAGGLSDQVNVGDVIIATGAHTSSSMNESRIPGAHFSAVADFRLAAAAMAQAGDASDIHLGTVLSNDHFYDKIPGQLDAARALGVLGVEMEAAALYGTAAAEGKSGLAVLTVSDHMFKKGTDMTAAERENRFGRALELAVAAALS